MKYTLGEIIKNRRNELDISQVDLSKLSGVDCKTISLIERNIRKKPIPETLISLSDALNLDCAALFVACGYNDEELIEIFGESLEEDYAFDFIITIKGDAFITAEDEKTARDIAAGEISKEILNVANNNELLNEILHGSDMTIKINLKD